MRVSVMTRRGLGVLQGAAAALSFLATPDRLEGRQDAASFRFSAECGGHNKVHLRDFSYRRARPPGKFNMRVSCFTFIRNGTKLKYPFVESIRSALPLCDEFIVAVGDGQDDTRERVSRSAIRRIRHHRHRLEPATCTGRDFVHAQQKMIAHYNCTGDWAFYIEGDEILHEDDVEIVRVGDATPLRQSEGGSALFRLSPFQRQRRMGWRQRTASTGRR